MIRGALVWIGIVLLGVVALCATALGYRHGIPRPPAITTENVPSVSWTPLVRNVDLFVRGTRSVSFVSWMPQDHGMLVRASHLVLDRRLHHLPGAGEPPRLLWDLPRNAAVVSPPEGRDYLILSWDDDGTEQFQLYRWDPDDEDVVRLTNGTERASFGAWAPEGSLFAFTSNRRNGRDMDVYVAHALRPGSERLVYQASGTWGAADWSPDGRSLLLARIVSSVENELHLLDLESGETSPLSTEGHEPVAHASPRFARDGSGVILVSDRGSEFKHVRRVDLADGAEQVLTDEIPWDVESVHESHDGSLLLLGVNEDGRNGTWIYDVDGDTARRLDLFPDGLWGATLHPDRNVMAVDHVDGYGVTRTYLYDLERDELTLWGGDPPAHPSTPLAELIRYPTFDDVDGRPRLISAFLYPGEGSGARPVVIDIHGGPEAQARLTTRHLPSQRAGLTVIAPNVRGSTGYGKSFTRLDDGRLREDAVKDIGALLDWIDTRPDLDGNRVAVTGGSYGGYMVLASLVHFGERIRCGVDVVGVSNFVTFLENTAPYRRDLRRAEYGDERDPEMRRFLESISPLNAAHRIVSPLMVVQGANDPRVPVGESRQMVERVRANDRSVSYIEAADEGHGFRKPWNALYARAAETDRLASCLGVD